MTVAYVLATTDCDEVWWVPCFEHAFSKELQPFAHRFQMCRLACSPFCNRVRVSDVEARMGKTSRTIDTVEFLQAQNPRDRFSLVIGADILLETHLWKRFDELEKMVDFVVLGRSGFDVPGYQSARAFSQCKPASAENLGEIGSSAPPRAKIFSIVLPEVSSTEVRSLLASGHLERVRGLLPANVLSYIQDQKLYQETT